MKLRYLLAAFGSLLALNFTSAPASAFTMTFNEYGSCSIDGVTCSYFISPTDPTSTASAKAPGPVLIFQMPPGITTYSGNENILNPTGPYISTNISDHLRWVDPNYSDLACTATSNVGTCATMMIFYSLDNRGAPADVGFMTFGTGVPSVREDATGAFQYTSGLGNIYNGVSEVPLPGALPLFATGLGALGLLGWCRKRKAQA